MLLTKQTPTSAYVSSQWRNSNKLIQTPLRARLSRILKKSDFDIQLLKD